LQHIEDKYGRVRSGIRNEARTLDLDLLAFGSIVCNTPELTLPHPRAHERRFVLQPWMEIAGEHWRLHGKTLSRLLHECEDPPLHRLSD
ncbi:MAG TPA: 2-amino-4-hydroxy-6-hydroxymethyldihydropteridine diphosphokinase, partial [Pseudomonadales bacterium]